MTMHQYLLVELFGSNTYIFTLAPNTNDVNRQGYSQLQDQDDLCLVFKDLMEGYDV